ncbi:2-dehydro-3-deoxygluconokinase [Kribbella orskensis]|uniref:2-dehydro-3-deoxygluconokinase n=1 Tax=Kribbella orskensis TaxID=2512216 RepID=A0ABY2BCM7_9ACTN|nr:MULTISPECIES: sugar kinase [Kribbella]TCN35077.1 2-dehydro-3-deoxygluconokinase [Kribbella sp. VKM Ac-2500]TCO16444.1 2-dehydro-3-deoxygluconokinase [Kribbella orskensis]
MPDVLTFGEAMVSIRTRAPMRLGGEAHLSVAGSESNVAIGLARLGHHPAWIGAVGNDEPGRLIQRTLRAEGVDTSYLRFSDDSFTGFIAFDQPAHDITRVSYHRRGSAASTLTADECVAAITATPGQAAPRLLHVTGISPAISESARAATLAAVQAGAKAELGVSLDVNYRARLWSRVEAAAALRELLPHVTTVFASDDELGILTDASEPIADLLSRGIAEVVVTAGGKGAWSHSIDGVIHRPALPVTVVDSIGAGDAFVSGYLSATLDNLATEARLDRATSSGAFCVGAHGDWESLPTREDLTLLTHTHGTALR